MFWTLIILQTLLLLMIMRLRRRPEVSPVLSTSLLFFAVIWYVTPLVITTILFWMNIANQSVVGYELFISYATLETLMLLLTLLCLLRQKPYFRAVTNSRFALIDIGPEIALPAALVTVGALLALDIVLSGLWGATYFERNAFAVAAEGTSAFNSLGSFEFLKIMLGCFCYACLLTRWPPGIKTRVLYIVIITWVVVSTLYQVLGGARVWLVTPFILLVLYGRVRHWPMRKKMLLVATPALLTVLMGGILVVVISKNRGRNELTLRSTLSKSAELIQDERLAGELGEAVLIEIVTKFDSFSTGAFLVRREGFGVAGWAPYHGSFLAPVPRALLASKPVPGSADGTSLGHPSRLVAASLGMDPASGNVNLSPAAISIWQLGYLGLILLVVVNVIHLQLINSLLLTRSIIHKTLALYLIGLPTLIPMFTTADYLIMNIERVILVYGLLWIAYKAVGRRQRRARLTPRKVASWPGTEVAGVG